MLDQETSNFIDPSAIPHLPFCEIHDEDSLEALLIKRNQSVLSDALNVTQKLSGADQAQVKISFLAGPLEVPGQHSRLRFIFSQSKETSHGYHFRIIETSQAERICRGFQGTLEYKAIPWSSNASDNYLGINLAPWWLHLVAWESHEICYWYPPLAENIGAQTKEFGLAVRPSHAGTKRRRDRMSDEDDGSYAYLPPNRQQCARLDLTPKVVRQTGPPMLEHSQTTSAEDCRYLNGG